MEVTSGRVLISFNRFPVSLVIITAVPAERPTGGRGTVMMSEIPWLVRTLLTYSGPSFLGLGSSFTSPCGRDRNGMEGPTKGVSNRMNDPYPDRYHSYLTVSAVGCYRSALMLSLPGDLKVGAIRPGDSGFYCHVLRLLPFPSDSCYPRPIL